VCLATRNTQHATQRHQWNLSLCYRTISISTLVSPPPVACIFGFVMSRLYSTCIPPVSHRILGNLLYPCIYLHLAILQQIHGIPLYLTILQLYPYVSTSSCIQLPAVSSCISPYPTTSKTGYGQKYTPGERAEKKRGARDSCPRQTTAVLPAVHPSFSGVPTWL